MKGLIGLVIITVAFGLILRLLGSYFENDSAVTVGFIAGWLFQVVYDRIENKNEVKQ